MIYFVPMQDPLSAPTYPEPSSPLDRVLQTLQAYPGTTLVAVSKTRSVEAIHALYQRGLRDFGENSALELQSKARVLPDDIRWHFIGHLQTNKVKTILPWVSLVHSVDSPRLAEELQKRAAALNRHVGVLWQVRIAREETKHGFEHDALHAFLENQKAGDFPNLQPKGLMGMATFTQDQAQIRQEFATLQAMYRVVKERYYPGNEDFLTKSMGMSGDYLIALQEGSTMIRLGSLLFEPTSSSEHP